MATLYFDAATGEWVSRGELRRRQNPQTLSVKIDPEWLRRKEPAAAEVVDSKPLLGGYTMGVDIGQEGGDRSVLALAGPKGLVGFMDLEQGSPTQPEETLRTLYLNDDVGWILTWEEFRRTIEEYTGMRFADHVEVQVVDEKPLSLPPPGNYIINPPGAES